MPTQALTSSDYNGFWQTMHNSDLEDSSSSTWLNELYNSLPVGKRYIQLAGSDDDNMEFGVTNYQPAAGDPLVTVYCATGENCAGFPPGNPPQIQVRIRTGWFPANSPDSEMVIIDKSYNPGSEVWFQHACAPLHANDYCSGTNTQWTATSMSTQSWASDGLDGCWPNNYAGKYPSPYDASNEGHKGIPSPYTAVRYWEAAGGVTGNLPIGRTLVIKIPDTSELNYFPMSGHDSAHLGSIPEGAILRLRSSVDLSPYPTGVQRILQALKD